MNGGTSSFVLRATKGGQPWSRRVLATTGTTTATTATKKWRTTTTFAVRSLSSATTTTNKEDPTHGMGFGPVRDRIIPTSNASLLSSMYRHCAEPHTCTVIGAPMTYGQPFVGTDRGPQQLRDAGLRSMLTDLLWRVDDRLDISFPTATPKEQQEKQQALPTHVRAKNAWLVGQSTHQVATMVRETLERKHFPLVLGGDHSIAIGTLAAVLAVHPNAGVLWIDAHADINTPLNSESGNMHGMPVGMLLHQDDNADDRNQKNGFGLPGFEWLQSWPNRLSPSQIVYIGLRDVDVAERDCLWKHDVAAYTMHEIDRYGIGQVMDKALHHLLKDDPNRPLYLTYDIDAIDPFLAPATGTTVRGGLTYREAHYVAEAAAKSGNLIATEVVELNPNLVPDGQGAQQTVDLGLQIITSLMGKSII